MFNKTIVPMGLPLFVLMFSYANIYFNGTCSSLTVYGYAYIDSGIDLSARLAISC